MTLTSPQNPLLQKVRRAVEGGRALDDGRVAAEGPHLLAEALESNWQVAQVFCSTSAVERHHSLLTRALRHRIDITEVAERTFKQISGTEQNQGILALLQPRNYHWTDLLSSPGPLVILDGIQDPGNAGTILRSAEAFGASGIAFTQGSVRISNGKLLRAAAGSLFRLPVLESLSNAELIQQLRNAQRPCYSLSARANISLFDAPLDQRFALAVGSEGAGISPALMEASRPLSIPTQTVESLNAAVACSLALFEAARRRGLK